MSKYPKKYDIIVVGAGHAGCEAALACARIGCDTLLLAIDLDKIAAMPCSPSIGGMAKGQLVKEIDALGGEMARVADATAIEYRLLNTKKGPAVRSSRTQNDKLKYHGIMKSAVERQSNLDVKQALVEEVLTEDGKVSGVVDNTGYVFESDAVVIAAGTFLRGLIHIGFSTFKAGRAGEFAAYGLAESLEKAGLVMGRMKTGTPPRLKKRSIDFSQFTAQFQDGEPVPFSRLTEKLDIPHSPSYMGRTNPETHRIVRENLENSALISGRIKGVAARYCPSFEDKIVRFGDREGHHVILEPEGMDTDEIYASGLGNSMPMEVQLALVRSVRGLEEAEIMRPAYAIEYSFVNPQQLFPTLETKKIKGLFLAGQINGTSGYEEAAAQGLWAGINAALKVMKQPPFTLDRSEAYMGVMVDDLVTRGTSEPYRMFTSRAEYRLMLREDNADIRLMEKGNQLGLVDDIAVKELIDKKNSIFNEIRRIKSCIIKPTAEVNSYLESRKSKAIDTGTSMDQLLKRAEMDYSSVEELAGNPEGIPFKVSQQVEIEIKYEGYIKRQQQEIDKFKNLENIMIPADFDFNGVHGLSNELKEKMDKVRPTSLGQASRMDGITPAAISVLMISIKARGMKA